MPPSFKPARKPNRSRRTTPSHPTPSSVRLLWFSVLPLLSTLSGVAAARFGRSLRAPRSTQPSAPPFRPRSVGFPERSQDGASHDRHLREVGAAAGHLCHLYERRPPGRSGSPESSRRVASARASKHG